jgi:hypothetical protein
VAPQVFLNLRTERPPVSEVGSQALATQLAHKSAIRSNHDYRLDWVRAKQASHDSKRVDW